MHVPSGQFTSDEALRTPVSCHWRRRNSWYRAFKSPTHFSVHIGDDIIELMAHDGTHMVPNSVGKQYVSQLSWMARHYSRPLMVSSFTAAMCDA